MLQFAHFYLCIWHEMPAVWQCVFSVVTRLKGFVCLCSSKPSKTETGVYNKERKDLFLGSGPCPETGELMSEDLAPQFIAGDGLWRRKSIMMTRKLGSLSGLWAPLIGWP